jgi:hypothetical protein
MKTAVMEAAVLHQKATLTVALHMAIMEAMMVNEARKRHQVIVMVVEAGDTTNTLPIQVIVGVVMEVGVMEAHHQPPHQEVAVVIMVVAVVIHLGIDHYPRKGIITNASIHSVIFQIGKDLGRLHHHLFLILLIARSQANGVILLDGGHLFLILLIAKSHANGVILLDGGLRKAWQVATIFLLTEADIVVL